MEGQGGEGWLFEQGCHCEQQNGVGVHELSYSPEKICPRVCVSVCVRVERQRGRREGEDDGRYAKRTCVRVSHRPVSQCVDVTLMQMVGAGIHLC